LIFSAGIILLLVVKHQLPDDKSYLSKTLVEDSKMLFENLTRALGHYSKTFGHDPKAPLVNLLRWSSLIWPLSFLGATLWAFIGLRKQTWGLAHLWASVLWITLGILLVSRYFHIMGSSNHYLSLMPTLSLFVLALYNDKAFNIYKKYLIYILLPILAGLAIHHVYFFQFTKPYFDHSRINKETVKDFPLGTEPVGIVGNYWNSYIFGAFYPKQVAPTPYWGDYVRNWKLYEQAMDGRKVIVLGKGWMQPLTDSIYMGKYYLIRNSEIEVHKDTEYAEYQSFKIENEN
jgi:hypothetical protein